MNYANMVKAINHPMIDMRSDTVTKPTRGMLDAMVNASVGDDVYGDDPTANELQEFAAKLLGKEAALFLASRVLSPSIFIVDRSPIVIAPPFPITAEQFCTFISTSSRPQSVA